jgi:hypothetical protein
MPPPLPPTRLGFDLSPPGKPILVEIYLDVICPFSIKMYRTVYQDVLARFKDDVHFVLHHVPQPWHPQGSFLHEAALCVRESCPSKYAAFVMSIMDAFDKDGKFTDAATWDKSRAQVYAEIVALAKQRLADTEVAQLEAMLRPADPAGHQGNQATQLMKWAVKGHRSRSVHMTPTVYLNGVEAAIASSSWTGEQWAQWLTPLGKDSFQGSLLQQ